MKSTTETLLEYFFDSLIMHDYDNADDIIEDFRNFPDFYKELNRMYTEATKERNPVQWKS